MLLWVLRKIKFGLCPNYGPVVQLVRTLACHARGQGFESPSGRHLLFLVRKSKQKELQTRVESILIDCLSLESEENLVLRKSKQKELQTRVESILIDCLSLENDYSSDADLAHLVERDLAKVEVAGSSPVIRSILWCSSQVVRPRSATPLSAGSNPACTSKNRQA